MIACACVCCYLRCDPFSQLLLQLGDTVRCATRLMMLWSFPASDHSTSLLTIPDDITPTCHVTVSLGSNEESTKSISGVTPVFGQSFSLYVPGHATTTRDESTDPPLTLFTFRNVTSYLNNVEFRVIKAGVPSAPQMEVCIVVRVVCIVVRVALPRAVVFRSQ